jgi:hypothetical protein
MLFDVYCRLCGEWMLRCDSEKLDFPFTPEMFTIPYDSPYGRMWSLPRRIDLDLQCPEPECGAFPFGFTDGSVTPYLRVKMDEDKRFSRLLHLDEIRVKISELQKKQDFEARVQKVEATHKQRSTILTVEKKAEISKKLDEIRSKPSAHARKMEQERRRKLRQQAEGR